MRTLGRWAPLSSTGDRDRATSPVVTGIGVEGFYSRTGAWWEEAESGIGEVDRRRAAALLDIGGSGAAVLELGCGYGSTASACAAVGLEVTAIDLSDRIQFATAAALSDNPRFIRGDFDRADVGSDFDVVCYWDGFGVGGTRTSGVSCAGSPSSGSHHVARRSSRSSIRCGGPRGGLRRDEGGSA